jgi:hypothetical protein
LNQQTWFFVDPIEQKNPEGWIFVFPGFSFFCRFIRVYPRPSPHTLPFLPSSKSRQARDDRPSSLGLLFFHLPSAAIFHLASFPYQ